MTIKATLWDKISPVTLSGKEFSPDFLLNHWNGESRVLISYDGIISRVQHVTDADFSPEEKAFMLDLINSGTTTEDAIAATWQEKAKIEYERGLVDEELNRLRTELADTDYKITKCAEYQLSGLPLPYDITELHATRQELRDRINELEGSP